MRKMNNKGYMLVEIILAFAITFTLLYFIMDLVLKMKNKNDDLLVETVVRTDSTIITNGLMEYAKNVTNDAEASAFCGKIIVEGKKVKYGDDKVIAVVDDIATIGSKSCNYGNGRLKVKIPIGVNQMKDENFDILLDYYYDNKAVCNPVKSYKCKNAKSDDSGNYAIEYDGECKVIDDGNGDWRIKFLEEGEHTLKVNCDNMNVDVFLVGGGGGGGTGYNKDKKAFGSGGGGGGGGYANTQKNVMISGKYSINIGLGGSSGGGAGNITSAFGYFANGGEGGYNASDYDAKGQGGTGSNKGGDGGYGGYSGSAGGSYGNGSTCEFGEGTSSGCIKGNSYAYAGGGGGHGGRNSGMYGGAGNGGIGGGGAGGIAGIPNTGGGGGGGRAKASDGSYSAAGGSGIVIIRNARDNSSSCENLIANIGWWKSNYSNVIEFYTDGTISTSPENGEDAEFHVDNSNEVRLILENDATGRDETYSFVKVKNKYNFKEYDNLNVQINTTKFKEVNIGVGTDGESGFYIGLMDSGKNIIKEHREKFYNVINSGGLLSLDVSNISGDFYIYFGVYINGYKKLTNMEVRFSDLVLIKNDC